MGNEIATEDCESMRGWCVLVRKEGLSPGSLTLQIALVETPFDFEVGWWAVRDLNPRHPACKAGALTN